MRPSLLLFLAAAVTLPTATYACGEPDCFGVAIVDELSYDAALPETLNIEAVTLEICFGSVCDQSRVVIGNEAANIATHCEDLDRFTPRFQTTCALDETGRTLHLTTNTADSGHAGSDVLIVTAVSPGGERVVLVRGTVTYEDRADDFARAACSGHWHGTFTKT